MDELDKYGSEKFVIKLLGGETSLVHNLNEVIEILRKYNLQRIEVFSNSLIRKRYPWILEDPSITYNEHLFYQIKNNQIEKLGNYDFLPENNFNNFNFYIRFYN
jgi:uncharacterized radical SAM superfamily Fe-S cluster-containing enzyme